MIISKTPLRMSFFGGGSDLANYFENSKLGYGSVISTAINMYIYITVNRRRDSKIRVVYFGNELVDSVDEIKHDIIRNALQFLNIQGGLEIFYCSDISISSAGLGLSSSSALTVGVLNALHKFKGEDVSPMQLALEAYHIERDCIGQACGIQDQLAVAFGGFREYKFYSNWTITEEKVDCDEKYLNELKSKLMLFYMGDTEGHRDSGKILKEQEKANPENNDNLNKLVLSVARNYGYLKDGKVDMWGEEFDQAWNLKKHLSSKISNPQIDALYQLAKDNGALGGKVLGAGGGGFMLLFVPLKKQENMIHALKDCEYVEFKFEDKGSHIIYTD